MVTSLLRGAAFAAAIALAGIPADAVADANAAWYGYGIGQPLPSSAPASLGTLISDYPSATMMLEPASSDSGATFRMLNYRLPTGELFTIITAGGRVMGLVLRPGPQTTSSSKATNDPLGYTIGVSGAAVQSEFPGAHVSSNPDGSQAVVVADTYGDHAYIVRDGIVIAIYWAADRVPQTRGLPTAEAGSIATAHVATATTENAMFKADYAYLRSQPCAAIAHWAPSGTESVVEQNGRTYDRIGASCPADESMRDFYFERPSFADKH